MKKQSPVNKALIYLENCGWCFDETSISCKQLKKAFNKRDLSDTICYLAEKDWSCGNLKDIKQLDNARKMYNRLLKKS